MLSQNGRVESTYTFKDSSGSRGSMVLPWAGSSVGALGIRRLGSKCCGRDEATFVLARIPLRLTRTLPPLLSPCLSLREVLFTQLDRSSLLPLFVLDAVNETARWRLTLTARLRSQFRSST